MDIAIIKADARKLPLRDECIQCVVTSPPYWNLRKYSGDQTAEPYGLERTIDIYIQNTVSILSEIRRVLCPDGVVFWNIGDSYCSDAFCVRTRTTPEVGVNRGLPRNWYADANKIQRNGNGIASGLKPKDLCLIPERTAIAAQMDGWWVRSVIIWAKPNPMPESAKDRPTNSYERILMLTKSQTYFWDCESAQEPTTGNAHARGNGVNPKAKKDKRDPAMYRNRQNKSFCAAVSGEIIQRRNIRNVWQIPTQPYSGAHFATFPEEIPRRCIALASRMGDIILDPFGGSGTTARVAAELNRRAISIDLAYHDQAQKRTAGVQRRLISA